MKACLQHRRVEVDDRALYDLRYFYVDEGRVGHYTCGVAFEAMMSVFRAREEYFCSHEWYTAVRLSTNPVVRGFLAEHICLTSIANNGLVVVDKGLATQMPVATFQTEPDWSPFLCSAQHCHLYVPIAYNFKAVDGVILLLDRQNKKAHMFLIQVTLGRRHSKSADDFYASMWWDWVRPLGMAGFENVQSTFVWIDQEQRADGIKSEKTRASRSGEKAVQPEYRVVHIGIDKIDRELATALGCMYMLFFSLTGAF
jgi:hypothetical protein